MQSAWTISDFLGYTSIACWLGAQFPQILENIKQQSCEGLALPFLANWALGDLSNLIGCLLTHQLPFQTLLASYFVFVDCTLLLQYLYYSRKATPVPYRRSRSRFASGSLRRAPSDRIPRYRTLSVVAANVAAAAALAAQQAEHADPAYAQPRTARGSMEHPRRTSFSYISREAAAGDEAGTDAGASDMLDSFHSEHLSGKCVSWSTERLSGRRGSMSRSPILSRSAFLPASLHVTPTGPIAGTSDAIERGRSMQRDNSVPVLTESPEGMRRSSKGASRRSAGMVFLAIWSLFSIEGFTGGHIQHLSNTATRTGRVLYAKGLPVPDLNVPSFFISPVIPSPTMVPDIVELANFQERPLHELAPDHVRLENEPSGKRILGRIFAWLCTTLYLTSRLPQIWKNFARKSVEGLSMYLFVFAFFGNVFYVASILSSPNYYASPPKSTEFIRESIPYLLGSGGTLVFDITIVSQSFVYRARPHRGRSMHRQSRTLDEESAELLTGDTLSPPPLSSSAISQHGLGTNESTVQSRGRTVNNQDES